MKKLTTSAPHDAVFKKLLSYPKTTRDFLNSCLPVPLRELYDLSTLKLEPGGFIEEDLCTSYSDVPQSLETRTGKDYIYALIEHQSSPGVHMAFRMMRYVVTAMQSHFNAGHKTLSLVVPILFYYGVTSPYPFSLCWLDELDGPETVWQLYEAAFPPIDVMVMLDNEVM